MDPDAGLIRRMNQGDDEAIEAFVRKYYPQILGYCCYHLRHRQDGEDVTQETFARFFASLDRYRHYGKAANYLYVIAGNLCRDHLRRRQVAALAGFRRVSVGVKQVSVHKMPSFHDSDCHAQTAGGGAAPWNRADKSRFFHQKVLENANVFDSATQLRPQEREVHFCIEIYRVLSEKSI